MTPGGKVSFTYTGERGEDDEVPIEIEAEISDYYPAVFHLRNGEPGYPAEGGEVEEFTTCLPDGTELQDIPSELNERICELAIEEHANGQI